MDVIAIDPSLICTAVVVNGKKFIYTGNHIAYTEKGKLKRWFEEFDGAVTVRTFELAQPKDITHSELELRKLRNYCTIIQSIFVDLSSECADITSARVAIEGYSYSSVAGPLIDLVTFGTILRYSLWSACVRDISIVPPQELKTKAASLAYLPVKKGKVVKFIGPDGKSAGSFKKQDMLQCLLDIPNMPIDVWLRKLRDNKEELLALKSTPKPVEDVNDAALLYEWLLRNP